MKIGNVKKRGKYREDSAISSLEGKKKTSSDGDVC
jgi:hypothetical protein